MAVFLSSDLSADVTGRVFTARGGYVGLHRNVGEELLALRDESTGAWPVDELAEQVLEKLSLGIHGPAEDDA